MNINKADKSDAYPSVKATPVPSQRSAGAPTPATESAETVSPRRDEASSVLADRLKVSAYERGNAMLRLPFQTLLMPQDQAEAQHSFALGRAMGRASDNPQDALRLARQLPYLWNAQDMAIVQHPNGQYQAFELQRTDGVLDDDLDNYQQLRSISSAQISGELNGELRLVAVMSDNKSLRFLQPQAGPAYDRPADVPPMLSASASTAQRQERVALLQKEFAAVEARLAAMAEDLGSAGDHRGIFTNLYNITTQSGMQEVERLVEAGKWREAEFLTSLCVDFANRYFDAYDAYTQGPIEDVPEAWRNAFDLGRQAQDTGLLQGGVSKVLGLSMVAHIINDLPQTLQHIGYPDAEDRDSVLRETYDFFDAALMDQKASIMDALRTHYGVSDTMILDHVATQLPFDVNNKGQKELFTLMRDTARTRAETLSQEQIKAKAIATGDWVRRLVPGLT